MLIAIYLCLPVKAPAFLFSPFIFLTSRLPSFYAVFTTYPIVANIPSYYRISFLRESISPLYLKDNFVGYRVLLAGILDILFIYFRERRRKGEREGEKYQCVVASHVAPTGDLAHNPGMSPD